MGNVPFATYMWLRIFCHSVEGQRVDISLGDITEHESGTSRPDILQLVSKKLLQAKCHLTVLAIFRPKSR